MSPDIQSGSKTKCSIEGVELDIWLALYWKGPIGVGIFLVCLGGMILLLSKADEINKGTKVFVKETRLEK